MLADLPDQIEYREWPQAAGESVAGTATDREGHVVNFAISWGSKKTVEGRQGPSFPTKDSTGVWIDYSGGRWGLEWEEPHPATTPGPDR